MKAKRLDCFQVNGKVFVVDSETGILVQCQQLSNTIMPTFNEYEAIFNVLEEANN